MFPPVYQMIFNRHLEIQKWAEPARIPINVGWVKEGKVLVDISDERKREKDVDHLYVVAAALYGGIEARGRIVSFERNIFIKVHFEKVGGRDPFDVLLTDADIILVC
ncbi:MAG: hypothetical protein Q8Q90_03795 [bacterium]|nr:hypothetical protein [bacterium]